MTTSKAADGTVGEALNRLNRRLQKTSQTPELDSQVVLAAALGRPRSWVLAHPDEPMKARYSRLLEKIGARLAAGEPLPYVLGHWEFHGLDFELTPAVLIPRPETEMLVETGLDWLQNHPDCRKAADIGTGSGCIGIALAFHIPDLRVDAMDISLEALEVARRNAERHGVADRVEFSCGDLFSRDARYHLIAANMPYIPTSTLHTLPVYSREPTLALDGGADGMELIRRLLVAAPDHLLPGGMLLMEIEASEGLKALSFACDIFSEARIHLHKDLAGNDRLLQIQV